MVYNEKYKKIEFLLCGFFFKKKKKMCSEGKEIKEKG
jgi:hypothetical protein